MFRNHSAWFSETVPLAVRKVWKQQEGKVKSQEAADFLISDDPNAPDTQRSVVVEYDGLQNAWFPSSSASLDIRGPSLGIRGLGPNVDVFHN